MIDCDETTCKKLMLVYTGIAIFVFFAIAYTSLCGKSAYDTSIDKHIAGAKEQQRQIGIEIAGARTANERAGEANERAAKAISDSQRAASEISTGVESVKSQIAECREIAGRNAQLIDELIKGAGAATQAGSGDQS